MEPRPDRLLRWALGVWLAIGVGLVLLAFWWVLREPIRLILPPVAIAAGIIYVLNPSVTILRRLGVPRPVGALIAYLIAGGAVWLGLAIAGPILLGQAGELVDELPRIAVAMQDSINAQLLRIGVPTSSLVDMETAGLAEAVRSWFSTNRDQVLELLRGAGSVVTWVAHLALALALGPIIAFYALSDLPRLSVGAGRLLPPERRAEVMEVGARIGGIVGSYFRGQLVVATFVGTATALGMWAIGLPFWAVVGITTGLFNLVPLIGPTTGAVFGVTLALTVGSGLRQAVIVVIVMVVVQQLDNHVVTPLVVGRSVSIHPITVIVALVFAGSLGGIPLMFVAIPAVATLKLVLLHVAVTRLESMRHLALLDDDSVAASGTVASLALDLRRSFERRIAQAKDDGGAITRRLADAVHPGALSDSPDGPDDPLDPDVLVAPDELTVVEVDPADADRPAR